MGGSAVLELSKDVSFYLVCQLLKGCTTGSACLLLYLEPHLIVRRLAIYFLFYLQTLYVVIQRIVYPRFQVLERYSVENGSCIADLEHWLYRAVELAPGTRLCS